MEMGLFFLCVGIGAGLLWLAAGVVCCWRERIYQDWVFGLFKRAERPEGGLRNLVFIGQFLLLFALTAIAFVLATVFFPPIRIYARWVRHEGRKASPAWYPDRFARHGVARSLSMRLGRKQAATTGMVDTADMEADCEGIQVGSKWQYCYFKKPLPFEPMLEQVFYVESRYDAGINNGIRGHYEEIRRLFLEKGFDFAYLPETMRAFLSDEAVRKFYYPMMEDSMLTDAGLRWRESGDEFLEIDYRAVFGGKDLPEGEFLFCYAPWAETGDMEEGKTCFAYCRIRPLEEAGLMEQFAGMCLSLEEEHSPKVLFRFSRVPDPEPDFGSVPRDVEALLEDVKQKLRYLQQAGVKESVIRGLFTQERKLSRLRVTADFRILLPDYAKEIALNPLEKAVYLLFLRHPEGLLFKELVDCREELQRLYMWVGGRSRQAMEKSVDDLLDPTKNSLNEKCSRIKAAFLREFDEHLARRYCIDGLRGEAKKIDLPPELVEWEREFR